MDPIKEAFSKAKQDILNLQSQIESLKSDILSLKHLFESSSLNTSKPESSTRTLNPTDNHYLPSNIANSTANQQEEFIKTSQYGPKEHFNSISTGNDGVPTDRQTNQQTDRHTGNKGVFIPSKTEKYTKNEQKTVKIDKISKLEAVSSILESLDDLKKELRTQFKRLSKQEMTVFSLIYDLENQGFIVDYSLLAEKLGLSESSIRDYVQKIIHKGIPIQKAKENNKKIILKIDENLKKIANLQTITALRDL